MNGYLSSERVDNIFKRFLNGGGVDMFISSSNVVYDGSVVIIIFDISIIGQIIIGLISQNGGLSFPIIMKRIEKHFMVAI